MLTGQFFENSLKRIGMLPLGKEGAALVNQGEFKAYIKVLYLPAGYRLKVDFAHYATKGPTLFFASPNQFLEIEACGSETGHFLFYNQDFYCIHIHDSEVACDGLLFNNIKNTPIVELSQAENGFISFLFSQMESEFGLDDPSREEMLSTYLKQVFIKATRLWKKQHLGKAAEERETEIDFFRKFTLLVDEHYKTKHSVSDYADALFMAPKTITHKFRRLNLPQPSEIIKNRIVLEAKRLLAHSSLTAKEIAYELGYEDPAYFSRAFQSKTGETPSSFRAKFLAA